MSSFDLFSPCPRGLEAVLASELGEIGMRHAPLSVGASVPGGVHFQGGWPAAMAVNLHSRIASRVLLKLVSRAYRNENDIYALAREQRWEQWFGPKQTLRIDMTAVKSPLKSVDFATLKVKDAICDRLRESAGDRPSIDTLTPDVRVFVFLDATQCTLYLDTTGEPLFKRGWRLDKGAAPLRENLAAGILRLSGWQPGTSLYDPMCGSGTFVAEAAQVALGIAPGSARRFGFEKVRGYDITAWQALKVAAMDARRAARVQTAELGIFGSDISGDMLVKARANLERAGVSGVPLKQLDARGVAAPSADPGVLLANPPYGERIEVRGRRRLDDDEPAFQRGGAQADEAFFQSFGDALKRGFAGWQAFVLSADRGLPGKMRLRESQKTPLFNGNIECRLFRFDLVSGSLRKG